jgi:hypothetical protein
VAVEGVAEDVAHCLLEAVEVGADFVGEGEAAEDDASELGAWGGGGPLRVADDVVRVLQLPIMD